MVDNPLSALSQVDFWVYAYEAPWRDGQPWRSEAERSYPWTYALHMKSGSDSKGSPACQCANVAESTEALSYYFGSRYSVLGMLSVVLTSFACSSADEW